jgi:hypothetical protein
MDSIRETRQLSILAESVATYYAAIIAAIGAITGPVVPAPDSPDNILSRDVVGNKSDLQVQTITDAYSIMAYVKGLMNTLSITGYAVFPGASAPGPNVSMISVIHYISDMLENGTYGLSALKGLVDDLETRLTAVRAGYLDNINQVGLLQVTAARAALLDQITAARLSELDPANLPADIDTLLTRLSAARAGYLDNINQAGLLQVTAARAALLDQITAIRLEELDAANIPTDIDTLLTRLTAARAGYIDELSAANIPADIDNLTVNVDRILPSIDFWSLPQEEVSLTSVVGDKTLPDVVVSGVPFGATIVKAIVMFMFRVVENTNAAVNKLNGAQEIQIRDDSPSAWTDCINLVDDQFSLAASTREGGTVVIGSTNVAGTVVGDDTYNFQWDEAISDQDNLQFNDIQIGIRIWYEIL